MKIRTKLNQNLLWVILISVMSLLVHLFTYNNLGFHRDEFLYLALGEHLATGYWSNPPLIGLISYLSQILPGDPLLTTRLFPAIAGAVLVLLTGLIARELGGKLYAQVLACLSLSVSLLVLRGYSMLQPVPFDILFWTLILFWFLRYINTHKPVYLLLIGVAFGLGILNKYMVVFLAAGLFLAILFTPYRRLWINKYTWYAVVIAFLLFLPNLIWQYNHGFPVIRHMQELKDTQLVNVQRVNILIDQVFMFTFGSVVWISGLIWLLFIGKSRSFRVFGFIYLAVLMIFLILRGKSYYMAGLYPFMFAAGGVSWERLLKSAGWQIALAMLIVLLSIPLIPGGIPILSAGRLAEYYAKIPPKMGAEALLRWEDGRMHPLPQDFADMLGWDELGKIVIKASDTISDKKRIMIYAENYGEAGAIDHYGKSYGLPQVASFSDSYLLWVPDTIPSSIDLFFYVNYELGSDVDSLFTQVDSVGSITNPYARELGTTVYLCREPRSDFRTFWSNRVKEVKYRLLGY
jgi:4-amino-4-deoxy-L-arabinose transferase-like glycosyltransferase